MKHKLDICYHVVLLQMTQCTLYNFKIALETIIFPFQKMGLAEALRHRQCLFKIFRSLIQSQLKLMRHFPLT